MPINKYKVGGLFSGVGGIELGFEQAGYEISWANEFDKNACITYRTNFPNHLLIEQDIWEIIDNDFNMKDFLASTKYNWKNISLDPFQVIWLGSLN